ncbi:MAG TPA: L-histidine N(alpha)-methyltransferase [Alphaproteobacteria bacterium]|nr:L-histidine N(alpha)-methyltransferase [Alphaproteobacteria bacterium]
MRGETGSLARLQDLAPSAAEFRDAVLWGLNQPQKTIPCKFFYDLEGSRLFDAICDTPEYYPTRTELSILAEVAPAIARLVGAGCAIVEFGSGAGIKIRTLLDALETAIAYVPVDISRSHLIAAAEALSADYPGLHIAPVCADYTKPFVLPAVGNARPRWLGFFPGSTIGNFSPPQAAGFLSQARRLLGEGGMMLVGVDLKKDRAVLEAAYNDAAGVTAAFNLNLLARIDRELGGDFGHAEFRHRAFYDPAQGRIEMHLVSARDQAVHVAGQDFRFKAGETVHTENSYKYGLDQFRRLAQSAGWRPAEVWTDPDRLFSLHLLTTCGASA